MTVGMAAKPTTKPTNGVLDQDEAGVAASRATKGGGDEKEYELTETNNYSYKTRLETAIQRVSLLEAGGLKNNKPTTLSIAARYPQKIM